LATYERKVIRRMFWGNWSKWKLERKWYNAAIWWCRCSFICQNKLDELD
jgi:hypothetical protein